MADRGKIALEDISVDFEVGPAGPSNGLGFGVKETVTLHGNISEQEDIIPSVETNSSRALLVAAVAPLAWGTTYLTTEALLPPDRPLFSAALRALPAGLLLLALRRALEEILDAFFIFFGLCFNEKCRLYF